MKTTAKKAVQPQEATALLRADHKLVAGLFDQFGKARSASSKKEIAGRICKELKVHTQIEEEIFYPAFQMEMALKDHELVPETNVEPGSVDLRELGGRMLAREQAWVTGTWIAMPPS